MPAPRVTSESPWHIVLVLDDSGTMAGGPCDDLNMAIKILHQELETTSMGLKPYFRISVISFGSKATTLCTTVKETDLDMNIVANFQGSSGLTNATAALDEAFNLIQSNGGNDHDFEPFVFFLSDGLADNPQGALEAAKKVKEMSVPAGTPRIVTLGFGNVDDAFMKELASNPELYKKMDSSKDIIAFLPNIGTVAGTTDGGGADALAGNIMNL